MPQSLLSQGDLDIVFGLSIKCNNNMYSCLNDISTFDMGLDDIFSQAKVLEDASLTWAIVEMAGLASYFTKLQAFTPSFAAATASSSPLDTK